MFIHISTQRTILVALTHFSCFRHSIQFSVRFSIFHILLGSWNIYIYVYNIYITHPPNNMELLITTSHNIHISPNHAQLEICAYIAINALIYTISGSLFTTPPQRSPRISQSINPNSSINSFHSHFIPKTHRYTHTHTHTHNVSALTCI